MLKNYSICKIACLIVIIITLFFLSAVTSLAIEKETEYIFATGPMGGTFYPLGGIISQTWNEKIDDVSITAIVTAAGLENLRLLKDNEAAFAILPESISYFVLAKAYPEPIQIVVRKNSDFKSIVDLKGKKVAMGMKGGFQHIFGMQIFEYAGLSTKDFKPSFLGYTAAADQFVDNMIDGIFGYTGLPNSTFMQLSISPKIKLIDILVKMKRNISFIMGIFKKRLKSCSNGGV